MDKSEIPCRFKFCKNPSCKFWHPPVCQNYMSEKGCVYGNNCHFRHVEAEGKPRKRSKKGGAKGSIATLTESQQLGCVSQDSYPRKSILRKLENWNRNTQSNSSRGPGTKRKFGKERVHCEELSKSVGLMCSWVRLENRACVPARSPKTLSAQSPQ